jgi:hypothetical protein
MILLVFLTSTLDASEWSINFLEMRPYTHGTFLTSLVNVQRLFNCIGYIASSERLDLTDNLRDM